MLLSECLPISLMAFVLMSFMKFVYSSVELSSLLQFCKASLIIRIFSDTEIPHSRSYYDYDIIRNDCKN